MTYILRLYLDDRYSVDWIGVLDTNFCAMLAVTKKKAHHHAKEIRTGGKCTTGDMRWRLIIIQCLLLCTTTPHNCTVLDYIYMPPNIGQKSSLKFSYSKWLLSLCRWWRRLRWVFVSSSRKSTVRHLWWRAPSRSRSKGDRNSCTRTQYKSIDE